MKHKGSKDYGGAAPNPPGGGTAGGMGGLIGCRVFVYRVCESPNSTACLH